MMIQVDGSYHEGGGQILRTALGLCALTGQAFEITDIRKNRAEGGLKAQHLACVKAVASLCSGSEENAGIGALWLKFYPQQIKSRTLAVDIGTAGSITLLLQSLLVPVIFGAKKTRLKITGGTDVPFSPTIDYFKEVLLPQLRKYCESLECNVARRGFMSAGQGYVELFVKAKYPLEGRDGYSEWLQEIRSSEVAINLMQRGKLLQIKGICAASVELQKAEVARRQANAARTQLSKLNVPISIRTEYTNAASVGSTITLWAMFGENETSHVNPVILGSCALGEKSKNAEEVGKEAAQKLLMEIESNAVVDRHLADQMLPFLALAGGSMNVAEITGHCRTNIYTIEKFLGKCIEVDEKKKIISSCISKPVDERI